MKIDWLLLTVVAIALILYITSSFLMAFRRNSCIQGKLLPLFSLILMGIGIVCLSYVVIKMDSVEATWLVKLISIGAIVGLNAHLVWDEIQIVRGRVPIPKNKSFP
jgi:hypothetical protein